MTATPELIIVMPIYNEEANIEAVISEWTQELSRLGIAFSLLAINDGSKDKTGAVLRKLAQLSPEVDPVDKPNGGHGRTCRMGYELAVERGSTWVLQIDSDGQCDPQYFASFWQARESADAVFGVRKSRDDGFARVVISAFCSTATSLVAGVSLKDANVPYRLMRTEVLKDALTRIPADFDMQNMALTVVLRRKAGLRWAYVPIHFRDRQGGTNSINLKRIAAMGWEMLVNLHRVKR